MILYPNAKINIGLNVIKRRDDGYHNIETVFYPIPLYDKLEINCANVQDYVFSQNGLPVDAKPEDNLIVKTVRLLQMRFSISGIEIKLDKNIPYGAGLGGGSSDAAFTLKALNELFALGLSISEQESFIGQLGADCPFFIQNKPVFAQGIGNEFSPLQFSLEGYYLVLIKPNIYVSTKDAYQGVTPKLSEQILCETIKNRPVYNWNTSIRNTFEDSIFPKYPFIASLKEKLYVAGALYASMSGSGSSVYGIFEKEIPISNIPDCTIFQMKL